MAIHAEPKVRWMPHISDPPTGDPAALAEQALLLVGSDPRGAQRVAEQAVTAARTTGDHAAEVRALRASGTAARDLGRFDEALRILRAAVRRGERAGVTEAAAEARVSLAYVLLARGSSRAALAQAERAASRLRGLPGARSEMQRALILQRCGLTSEALTAYSRALVTFRQHGDNLWEARLHNNRGLLHVYGGSLDEAEADLTQAEQLFTELELDLDAARAAGNNLGLLAARRGDAPTALRRFDLAESVFTAHSIPVAEILLPRVDVLLSVGMWHEARSVAERAVQELQDTRNRSLLAEALLKLAQAALATGDAAVSRETAQNAARLFVRQRRRGWAALARYVVIRADERADGLTRSLRTRALRTAGALGAAGWRAEELDARLIAARVALAEGRLATVRSEMRAASAARHRGPTELRVRAWHAEALLRLATGDRRGAEDALRSGLRIVEERRAAMGATELRVHIAAHGGQLAGLGLDLALQSGSPSRVFEWGERWRAGGLRPRPVRPPADTGLATALAELRRISSQMEAALLATGVSRLANRAAPRRLGNRKAELEDTVRRLARREDSGARDGEPTGPPRPGEIAGALRARVLVEFMEHDGAIVAVTIRDGQLRLRELGPVAPIHRLRDSVQFALHRLARGHGSEHSLRNTVRLTERHAARLDALLLGPLDDILADRPLVLAPPGSLHAVPWSMLPHCLGRAVSVAPSADAWLRATRLPTGGHNGSVQNGRTVLACGPGLDGAAAEIDQLTQDYPGAVTLTGAATSVEATLTALRGAGLAHIAAHCYPHRDNPLFSALDLADGPLTVYDLEQLGRAPRLVLLPACQSGVAQVLPGNELMGFTSALLSMGTQTVIASVLLVPDHAAGAHMVNVHNALRRGAQPADALATATAEIDATDAAGFVTRAAFTCFGAG